jgi:outer membrane protein assembly factor BamB
VALEPGIATGPWPKFHQNIANTGIATLPRAETAAPLFTPRLAYPAEGSPVTGFAGATPAVFIHNDNNLSALNALTGVSLWNTTFQTGKVDVAPAVVSTVTGGGPGTDFLVTGSSAPLPSPSPNANVLAVDAGTGTIAGSFLARETYTDAIIGTVSDLAGPVKASPTVLNMTGPDAPAGLSAVLVGTDETQAYGNSHGRLYAIRPNGTIAWETLLAGAVHGSPVFAPPSLLDPDGAVYVGTESNSLWGGRPDIGGPAGAGRFYKLNAATGEVLAEMYLQSPIHGSAAFLAAPGTPDPNGANANLFFTTEDGRVYRVTPVRTAPPAGVETPSLTTVWTFLGNQHPTSPALSINGATIYLGDITGVRAIPVAGPGTGGWYSAVGQVQGSPAVAQDALNPGLSQVIVGVEQAGGTLIGLLDLGAAPTNLWAVNNPSFHYGHSSPAIGPATTVIVPPGSPTRRNSGSGSGSDQTAVVYIGSTDGTVVAVA